MKIKVSELTGAALDWAVAKCEDELKFWPEIEYSTDWSQAGPIIERERMALTAYLRADLVMQWRAVSFTGDTMPMYGETPLIAAMRCFVSSKLDDEIKIPEELK